MTENTLQQKTGWPRVLTYLLSICNLGVHFDSCMTMTVLLNLGRAQRGHNFQKTQLVRGCFYQLRRIKTIRKFVPTSTAVILVNSFIVSRVDYCNSLLAGLPTCQLSRIQSALNSVARVIYGRTPSNHVTDLPRNNLHWPRVFQRITYKLC